MADLLIEGRADLFASPCHLPVQEGEGEEGEAAEEEPAPAPKPIVRFGMGCQLCRSVGTWLLGRPACCTACAAACMQAALAITGGTQPHHMPPAHPAHPRLPYPAAHRSPMTLPAPQRKRLEPFEVPKSGAFWLHDDRFEAGEEEGGGGMRSEQVEGELDERQK